MATYVNESCCGNGCDQIVLRACICSTSNCPLNGCVDVEPCERDWEEGREEGREEREGGREERPGLSWRATALSRRRFLCSAFTPHFFNSYRERERRGGGGVERGKEGEERGVVWRERGRGEGEERGEAVVWREGERERREGWCGERERGR